MSRRLAGWRARVSWWYGRSGSPEPTLPHYELSVLVPLGSVDGDVETVLMTEDFLWAAEVDAKAAADGFNVGRVMTEIERS